MPKPSVADQRVMGAGTVERFARCHRLCVELEAQGKLHVTSQEISRRLGEDASLIRRDICCLGRLGTQRHGYPIRKLQKALGRILGKRNVWGLILVGAGKVGAALLTHHWFESRGFRFVAVFDDDADKIGTKIGNLVVQSIFNLPDVCGSLDAEIGVITVPPAAARWVARFLAANRVRGILNFTPIDLLLDEDVVVMNVDLAVELEKLCYHLTAAKTGKH